MLDQLTNRMFDYAALRSRPVATDPYPHLVVPEFLPSASLAQILADLPPLERRGSFPPASLRLGPMARALIEELEGEELRDTLAERFGLDLTRAPTMITVRGWTTERDGRIHCDSTTKRVTALLYLNPPTGAWNDSQGCLRLLRRPDDLEDFAVEVPPVNGTLLVFPNQPKAWHGHRPFTGQRYTIQLNYMTTDGAARSELRRHHLSALLKRLTAPSLTAPRLTGPRLTGPQHPAPAAGCT
jgi:SM-20-related protein